MIMKFEALERWRFGNLEHQPPGVRVVCLHHWGTPTCIIDNCMLLAR
jgi:hypothetical protein